ncbi:hypothetical protein [Campylobacter sp. 19-13652]|uniref:hypothetical protein n=1 Tax=Campylobacter sp. 19-13652 TaxID=2840180 RepID=UPI001C798B23|nr:hypothetical protein [Campylobacter sp. 19-13652]BCX78896.1 hypothetical protein LBC_03580 [Campylobacter sp. 19-13652]
MKKFALIIAALFIVGCASTQTPTKEQAQTKTEQAQAQSTEQVQQKIEQSIPSDLKNYLDEQDLQSKKDADEIKAKFKNLITSVEVSAFSRGIEAILTGTRAITKKELSQIGTFSANVIRKNRQISGKVNIYYEFDGKTLKGKY